MTDSNMNLNGANSPVEAPDRKKLNPILAAVLSALCAGLGQIYTKRLVKGIVYALIHALSIVLLILWIIPNFKGLITLGYVPVRDHSLVFLVYGILSIILFVVIALQYVSNIIDAYKFAVYYNSDRYVPQTFKARLSQSTYNNAPFLFLVPGLIGVIAVVLIPLMFSILIAFTDYDVTHLPPKTILSWVGLKNFADIFNLGVWGKEILSVLGWTFLWTILSSVLPYALGIMLAVLLATSNVKGKKIFKLIYILPWAIPGYISLSVLKTMFDYNYGLLNRFLELLNIEKIPWFYSTWPARMSVVLIAIWTGFSYPLMLSTSVMESIPGEIYEAADIDGANSWIKFWYLTFPHLMYSISPIFIMSMSGAFNNFNTIYLVTGGAPLKTGSAIAGDTDILISFLFKLTYNTKNYNISSAISCILFVFIAIFSIYNLRKTKNFSEESV